MKIIAKWKKTGIVFLGFMGFLYILFLILPLILSPVANSYSNQIEELIKVSTTMDAHIDGIEVITTPKLAIGLKIKEFSIYAPKSNVPVIELENAKADLRLLPLLLRKVQLGNVCADEIVSNIVLDKNGIPVLLSYIPEQDDDIKEVPFALPLGLKLSNHLPNIKIKDYKFSFIDDPTGKTYYIDGNNLKITDFVLDKSIKISTDGEIIFDKHVISNYDIKVYNKIMPNLQLDDLVFPKEVKIDDDSDNRKVSDTDFNINIIDLFDAVVKNGLKADLKADIKTFGTFKDPEQKGSFELVGMSVLVNGVKLPESYAKLLFKGKETNIDSIFYTSSDINEKTQLIGNIKSGKKPYANLTLRSNARFNNVIKLLNSIAKSFGINDLETVKASGGIEADFNINSNLETIVSTGYLRIPSASLKYGLYNVSLDNINANINLNDNNIDIKNFELSVMGHPLNVIGKISSDAVADLKIIADKLPIKGLIGAAGQLSLLKENNFNSGTISLNVLLRGPLNKIRPDVTLRADNINIYNKIAKIKFMLNHAIVKFLLEKDSIIGDLDINALKINHDMANISIPKALISLDSKDINIKNSYVMINNSKVDVTGDVKNYSNSNLNMDIIAKGNLASADIAAFIPREFKSMFPSYGTMPLSVIAKGNDKIQHITFDLTATPNGYVRFFDIDKLKAKNTKIHTDVKLENNSLIMENSGIFANSSKIASFDGGISNLANPDLNINVTVPQNISFPIPGMGNSSNITANGAVTISGNPMKPKLKGKVNFDDISVKDMDFALTHLIAHLNGQGISGSGTANKMKFGSIIGTNLSANFILNNFTIFNLSDIKADAYNGKVTGMLTYDIPKFAFGIDISGKGLNSTNAVYAATGIPKALTGTMDFSAKLTSKGLTDIEIIKNMKGDIDFGIENGRFISIGKLENLVAAQNITTNSILKSALSALTTAANIQETDKFKSITGEISMSGGNANISYINVSGPLMSYYVKGLYNILKNSANLVILGRLDSKVVSYLGPIGQLSAEKLLSYIPKFGASTAKFLKILTQDPKNERTELIPVLSSGSNAYKDFKVIYNGSLGSASSVKSFKWLSNCDTTQINIKQEVQNAVQAAKDNVKNQIQTAKTTAENVKTNVTNIVNTQKQNIESEKKTIEQTKQDIKNIKQNSGQSATNLGKLLINAASNANKKIESPSKPAQTDVKPEDTSSSVSNEKVNAEE